MIIVVLLMLAALALLCVVIIVAIGAISGAAAGAALGGTLPWIFCRRDAGKVAPNVFAQVVRSTLGLVGGGLLGGLAGTLVAAALIWLLMAAH